MSKRHAIPKRLEKALYQEAGSRCVFCREDDISTLVIHHIVPFEEARIHNPADMAVLCANCHARADRAEISRDQLYELKRHAAKCVPLRRMHDSPSVQTVMGEGNIVAGRDIHVEQLHIRSSRVPGKGRSPVIPGTVATDPFRLGYLKHLIRRYHEFKEWEVGKGRMRYPLIYKTYQREMRYSLSQTPLELFEAGCRYLQNRIGNTKLGRIRKKEGQRLYATFDEFMRTGKEE